MPVHDCRLRLLGTQDGGRTLGGELGGDVGQDVAVLVDVLRPRAARDVPLLVLAAAADAERARRTVSLARAGAPGAQVVVHASTLPPLARRGLGDLLASLSATHDARELLVLADALEGAMAAGAVLGSVTRLASPPPSMADHLLSWWPTSRFAALTHPHRVLVRAPARGGWTAQLGVAATSGPMFFASTGGSPRTEEAVRLLAQELTGAPATVVDPPGDSARFWATSRFTEFSAVPQDVHALAGAALAAARPCPSCAAPVDQPTCPWCHAAQPGSAGRPAARTFPTVLGVS